MVIVAPRGVFNEDLTEKIKELDAPGNQFLLFNLGKTTLLSTARLGDLFIEEHALAAFKAVAGM